MLSRRHDEPNGFPRSRENPKRESESERGFSRIGSVLLSLLLESLQICAANLSTEAAVASGLNLQ